MQLPFYDAPAVEAMLDYPGCIAAMRDAMRALSAGRRDQPLRRIVRPREGAAFGVMPGDLVTMQVFGAKLVSVFQNPAAPGRARHRGVVTAFDLATGALSCLADAEAVTTIRTACVTATVTHALARPDARVLRVAGTGTQAISHLHALARTRPWEAVLLWGRDASRAGKAAARVTDALGLPVEAVGGPRGARRPVPFLVPEARGLASPSRPARART